MPSKNPAQRLADIVDNVDAIWKFTSELDLPAFRADRKTVLRGSARTGDYLGSVTPPS
jgi:uncharacterized protein with HEPN domain